MITTNLAEAMSGGCILQRTGVTDVYYKPAANSNTARGATLLEALTEAELTPTSPAQITVGRGDYRLSASMAATNPGLKTVMAFTPGAALKYDDPAHAAADYPFFRNAVRNVVNFGAVGAAHDEALTDNWAAFQAAANSLGPHPNAPSALLPSGRRFSTGVVHVPPGRYGLSDTVELSATAVLEGVGSAAVNVFLLPSSATSAASEKFLFTFPVPVGVDTNNCFGTGLRGMTLGGNNATNLGGSGVQISGGQGTHLRDVAVLFFGLRGIVGDGVHFEGMVWVAEITRGPGIRLINGGTAEKVSCEHVNAGGHRDANGELYPSVELIGGPYEIGALFGEESGSEPQVLCRATNCISVNIGTLAMGVAIGAIRQHTLLDLRGATRASVDRAYGSYYGAFPLNPGTLVDDTSTSSPRGPGVRHVINGFHTRYAQELPLVEDGTLTSAVTKAKIRTVGNSATDLLDDGLTVTSSQGDIRLFGGRIECNRSTFYLNYDRTPLDISNGALTIDKRGRVIIPLPKSPDRLPPGALYQKKGQVWVAP